MEDLIEKLQPKWLAIILALFISGRAVTALLSPEFAAEIMSDGGQWKIYGLKFSYIGDTIFLPLLFALLAVELAKNTISPILFRTVLVIHFSSVLIISTGFGIEAISLGGSPVQGIKEDFKILSDSGFFRSIITLILVTITSVLAFYWQSRDYRVFDAGKERA